MSTAVVSIVTFVLGLLLGHRLALGRDKRKEFNEAAQPVREWLLQEASEPSPYRKQPSRLEMDTFVSCLSSRDRSRFNAALQDYRSECKNEESNSYGDVSYGDPERVKEPACRLLPFTDRR